MQVTIDISKDIQKQRQKQMTITLDRIGGFEATAPSVKGRAVYVGNPEVSRTPLYEVVDSQRVPVTDGNGRDCYSVFGSYKGLGDFTVKEGEYAGKRKLILNLDVAGEKIGLFSGMGTRTTLSTLQALNVLKDAGALSGLMRLTYKRGDRKPTAVFVAISVSSDGYNWEPVWTSGTPYDLPDDITVEAHCETLFARLSGAEEEAETYSFDAEF